MTSFLDHLRSEIAGSPVPAEPVRAEKTRDLVPINRWDQRVWTDQVRPAKPVDAVVRDLMVGDQHKDGDRKPFDAAGELSKGMFFQFYKAAPRLEEARNLDRDLYPARKILAEITEHPELQKLQDMTIGDSAMSTMAFISMAGELREILGRIPPPPPPPAPGGQQQGGGDQDQDQPDDGQGDEQGDSGGGEQAEADWEQMYDELLQDVEIGRSVHRAVHKAAEEAEELDDLRKGIGLEDGEWRTMSPEERLKLAERLRTDEMRALAKVIGRMKRFALGVKATRIIDVPHEAYDVEMGNDPRRLLQSQYALLATEETKLEFYRRYVDKELLQFKKRGTEEVGRGPIIICIDKSGSMRGAPAHWAMAVAESLRRFASEEDRDYYAMFFGNNNDRNRFDFPGGKGPFEKVLAFLSVEANGGTQFDGVLTEALQRASKAFDDSDLSKADVVFVTDGNATLSEQWITNFNAERERIGVRVYSIYINGGSDMRGKDGPEALLRTISDLVIPVKDLTPAAVSDVFARV